MQELKLADDLFVGLFDGSKNATIRLGKREIVLGALALEAVSGGWGAIVNVTNVRHKKMSEITQDEAYADGRMTLDEFSDVMKRFYPHATPDDEITIVFFTFKDPLDIPEDVLYGSDEGIPE